jgi:hypothetical protein
MFEVFFKLSEKFEEWNFQDAQVIRPPEIQGHRIPVNLDSGRITGEIVIARRPLSDDERGIAIMIGSHIVTRSNFGFEAKLNRVSGYIRCDSLTSRFADKSALIEDAEYSKFMDIMKSFVDMTVLPSLSQYEDVLITREESRIYKEIDKVLGQALIESSETQEEVEELSTIDVTSVVKSDKSKDHLGNSNENAVIDSEIAMPVNESHGKFDQSSADLVHSNITIPADRSIIRDELETQITQSQSTTGSANVTGGVNNERPYDIENSDRQMNSRSDDTSLKVRKIRTPVVKRTFALKKVGYKVIPYEDGSDSRYSFTSENVVFVNKANSTYKAEANRGDEFLLRHIINLVAEAVAQTKHPEGKDALELQNRLIAEAIRIHDGSINRK